MSDSFELRKLQAPRMIGVRVARGEAVLVDEPFAVELTAAQPLADEVPVGSVEVVLEKIESDWVHRRVNGTWTWSKREDAVERSKLLVEKVSASEQYSKVERTLEVIKEATVEELPGWFTALPGYAEKLAAVKANQLGDWDAFNEWLRKEYDAEDLAEFTFEDEEDLEIYNDFRAKRG